MSNVVKLYDGWLDGGYIGRVSTNVANTICPILKATFVDGFNTGRAITSITRSSTTATVTMTADHDFRTGQVLEISGCTETEYNGEFRVTVLTPRVFTYTVAGSPATPASGTPAVKVASLGWTSVFTPSGNKLVLRSANTGGSQFHFRISDQASMTIVRNHTGGVVSYANAFAAEVQSYDGMTDIDTGTLTGYMLWRKGAANGGLVANLNVTVIGDDLTGYCLYQAPGSFVYTLIGFGDFISDIPGEEKPAFVLGAYGMQSQNDGIGVQNFCVGLTDLGVASTTPGLIFARNPWGTGTNQTGNLVAPMAASRQLGMASQNSLDMAQMAFSGSLVAHPVYCQTQFTPVELRGRMPGIYQCFRGTLNPRGYEDVENVMIEGTPRTLRIFNIHGAATTSWHSLAVDITGPWR